MFNYTKKVLLHQAHITLDLTACSVTVIQCKMLKITQKDKNKMKIQLGSIEYGNLQGELESYISKLVCFRYLVMIKINLGYLLL